MYGCIFSLAVAVLLLSSGANGQLNIVIPDSTTTVTGSASYRLAGNTVPGRTAVVNNRSLKVYPSGAFVALLPLEIGENHFLVHSSGKPGESDSAAFVIVRTPPPASIPDDSLAIDGSVIEPSADIWVTEGDLLKVRCKGTPGCRATFLGGFPMVEVAPEEARGLRGIYEGAKRISDVDTFFSTPVVFQLESPRGDRITAVSTGTVTEIGRSAPLVGVTKGETPYLNFGLGGDRLGGAKMGFLVPGVRLTISGKSGDQFRVALAPDREAWIPANQVDLLPPGTHPPFSLTGSWNLRTDGKTDVVSVELAERLPFSSVVELSPTRIHVDLYGAVPNTNWITQPATAGEVVSVGYSVPSRSVVRLTIELKHKQLWGYSVGYRGTSLVISIRHQPIRLAIGGLTFAVDAGHGGDNYGALGATGAREKDVNLATAEHLQRLLEDKGARVLMTRSDDSYAPNSDRLKRVIEAGPDILISIHSNSIGNTTDPERVRGVSTYYRYLWDRPLSTAILSELLKAGLVSFGNVGSFNFALNGPTELPNVLVELAFMSHPEDEMKLLDDEFRRELAERIVDGVEEFLDECEE
jgi:N-acetylmuramoyl-L-alanine amidase